MSADPLAQQPTAEDPLRGIWRIVSWVIQRLDDATAIYPMGELLHGQIAYGPGDQLSVHLARPKRGPFAANDMWRGSDSELREAFESYFAYYGRYAIDAAAGVVMHHIQHGSYPNLDGSTQTRYFRIDGPRLELRSPPFPREGRDSVHIITWERLG